MSDITPYGLPPGNFTLTIGSKTFQSGDQVSTPDGDGKVIAADPFADEEIFVRLASGEWKWFSFQVVEVKASEQHAEQESK